MLDQCKPPLTILPLNLHVYNTLTNLDFHQVSLRQRLGELR